ncbi:MAG TPA: 30S ribosomal protein S6 [Terriglobia bacterium]|nr:30S ribosomal protein S6 [Terriglobia bacterium]HVB28910.1 30S ribosomal protein S6 [Terriglobia bacterium]
MAKYEMMFIVRTDVPEEEVEKLTAQMDGVVTGAGGKMEKIEKMGRRRLAYRVKKQREGLYILFKFEGNGDTVREFERRLKVTDAVVKFLTVRVDERVHLAAEAKAAAAKPAAAPQAAPTPASEAPAGAESASQS